MAERQNCILTRAILAGSDLPQYLWVEAFSTVVYLRNHSPMRVKGKTPFEALFSRKPNVEHIRVFGCVGYSLVPKNERRKLMWLLEGVSWLRLGSEGLWVV